jgi:predicted membrane-bound spermidine synthase
MRTRLSVFLITLSGLVLEVGLTRIYSASIWYHFAFVAVSVALLGWGLGGFTVHLLKHKLQLSMNTAALVTALYAITIPLCLWLLVQYPFEMARLPLYFLAPLPPFFLAGMALSIVFDLHRAISGSLYFYDLIGAAIGAVLVTLLLHVLGGEPALLTGAIAPAIAALLLSMGSKENQGRDASPAIRIAAIVAILITAGTAFAAARFGAFRVIPGTTKAMRNQMDAAPGSRITQTGWNAYSRIDAVEGVEKNGLARLYIDSDAWTGIREWDGRIESAKDLKDSYRALPFRLVPNSKTLIIGPGGGPDVVAALASGSQKVTAVEMNPLMLKFVRHYGPRAANLYDRPDVEAILSEGRNFISRTDQKFDIILLGFVDSWASVASGGLSLSENYLYTVEAFRAYYDHLTDNGILVILRWDSDIPRLVSNSVANLGAEAASQRIVTLLEKQSHVDQPAQMLFMLRKRPFTVSETTEIKAKWTQAEPIIMPGGPAPALIGDVLSGRKTLDQYEAESPRFVGAVWDDSPFYFAIDRPFRMPGAIATGLLKWLLAPSLAMLVLFAIFGRPRSAMIGPYAGSLVYFAALGFGFIAVELALLQNLTLLVGHPIFTLSLLLCTLLATGGIGSSLSWRLPMWSACLGVAVIAAIEALALPRLVPMLLWLPLWGRILVAIVMIAPLGLVMGMPFPSGLRRTGSKSLPAPPFYWGLNGVMSVIGSIATVFVALMAGFEAAMLMGSVCYLMAALASRLAFRESTA